MAKPFRPRIVTGKVRVVPIEARIEVDERRAIKALVEQLGPGLPPDDAFRRLKAACVFYQKKRVLEPHAPRRLAVLFLAGGLLRGLVALAILAHALERIAKL